MEKIKGFFASKKVRKTLLIGGVILGGIYLLNRRNKPDAEVTDGSGTWEELGEAIEEASE